MAQPKAPTPIDAAGHRSRVLRARDRLVEDHMPLVVQIAKRIHNSLPPQFDLEDLIATGNLGLIAAATRYKPRLHGGCPFSAWARHRIRGAILDSVRRRHFEENTRPSIEDFALGGDHCVPSDLKFERFRSLIESSRPHIEERIDREALLKRLENAIARLTDDQRALLDRYYTEDLDRLQRAHWRRKKDVAAMHAAIIEILRAELAS